MARRFARTWWGKAWIDALENRARLDPNRLPRGRTYARQDRVGELAVEPGRVTALVQGSRLTPYRVTLRVRTFEEDEWSRVLDAVAAKAGHAAALLDGDLDPGIVADAEAAGVELFPTAGELVPRCSCPDWADPCKHSAAVCYLVADRLDADPFELLYLRGRDRDRVLAGLRARRASGAPGPEAAARLEEPTMVARAAWARTPGTLPPVPGPRRRPGRPVPIPTDPPPDSGLDVAGLEALATDAVRRAWLMTAGEGRSHLDLKPDEDLARRADAALGTPAWTRVLAGSGLPGRELLRRAMAWRYAEADGVRTLDEAPWNPDRRVMAEARQRLVDARVAGGQVRVAGNAISWRDRRVRLGHDGRWWPLAKRSGRWEPAGAPIDDIDDLIDALQDAVDGSPPQDR